MNDDPLRDYIYSALEKRLKEVLAAAPWWCLLCGAGGNYEDERPDEYLPPPFEHVCPPLDMSNLRGIEVIDNGGDNSGRKIPSYFKDLGRSKYTSFD